MNIKTTIVEHQQGSEAWLQHRASSFNASELAAAMGVSPYMTRTELIAQKATGLVPEVDAAKQRIFDNGHRYEAIARPWAEDIIGEELFPVVLAAEVDGMRLSASLDGQTMAGDITWEHKSLNENLRQSLDAGVIPSEYHPQMEQGLMLSGASRCLFMASNGDRDTMRFAWYESQPALRAKIIPIWKQVQADAATYVPSVTVVTPTAKTVASLPVVFDMRVEGKLIACNLAQYKPAALAYIEAINTELESDQSFADAEADAKFCRESADKLKLAIEQALGQMGDVNDAINTVRDIAAAFDAKGLKLEKLVKARKEELRSGIVTKAIEELRAHAAKLSARVGLQIPNVVSADFAGVIKGKRSLASIQDAVDTELACAKIAANDLADRMEANIKSLKGEAHDWSFLFPDLATVASKPAEDFANLLTARIGAHKQAEEQRRQREEQAEAARKAREAEAAAKAAEVVEKSAAVAAPQVQAAINDALATGTGIARMSSEAVERIDPATVTDHLINLGEINNRLEVVAVNADSLAALGFRPRTILKNAKLYRESDFPAMCRAIGNHLLELADGVVA